MSFLCDLDVPVAVLFIFLRYFAFNEEQVALRIVTPDFRFRPNEESIIAHPIR